MRIFISFLFFTIFTTTLFSQNPSRTTIRGIVQDTTGEVIPLATVMLLTPKDSQLVNFTRGDANGAFEFKNVKNAAYLLKITYVSYLPLQIPVGPATDGTLDLGIVKIKPITSELLEVVIKAAKSTLSIRGDTIEYDASSFKVPPGSTVEDLLRRLPGIEVDAEGNVKAQGRDVKRVYVDGKTFFGDDPKAATKNLGAETLSKIQVYNEKSEQSKLTGVDDGKKEKAMNLELKEEYKKGRFGKITGAAGTEETWAMRGNYNRFNKKEQLSFIGYGNNINQTGINWDDYGEFKGQNTWNDNDNGDFGFSNGGGRRFYYFGGDDESPINNFDGRGFTKNHGGGSNYNYDTKKSKFNANYFYNQTGLDLVQQTLRQTFLADSSFYNTDTLVKYDFRRAHTVDSRLVEEFDSSNTLIVKGKARFAHNTSESRDNQLFYSGNNNRSNALNADNNSLLDSWRVTGSAIFRHRFKKKGRSFAVSTGYNDSKSDGTEDLFSQNTFYDIADFNKIIRQLNTKNNRTRQYKSSALFTDAFAKNWYSESFYNFSQTENLVNRQVTDPANNSRIDALSVFYDFKVLYNRAGSSLRYSKNGLNSSIGVAVQQLVLDGAYAREEGGNLLAPSVKKTYNNFTPNFSLEYETQNNVNYSASYSYGVEEPKLSDLQPVPNVNNPAFRTEGNPELSPATSHEIELGLNRWNPAKFSSIGVNANVNLYDSQVVYNTTVDYVDSIGYRTTTRPVNVSGGREFSSWLWTNFPIVKTKLTMNINGGVNASRSPALVNDIENETTSTGLNARAGLTFTPNTKLILGLSGNSRLTWLRYSIQDEQNQNIQNNSMDASIKWQFLSKSFFESNFNYGVYQNDRFGFNQKIPVWNASVRRLFGKENRVEARLSAFDIFNKKVAVRQFGSQNFVSRSVAPTLARYFMASLSYNLKGYENKLKKNDWW